MSDEQELGLQVDPIASVTVPVEIKRAIEALIFASDEPLTAKTIRLIFESMPQAEGDDNQHLPSMEVIYAAVQELNEEYKRDLRAFRIVPIAGGFAFATQKQFASLIGKLFKERARRRLTTTAIETLAIIAYKQPVTKSEVEFVRGVNADYIMKSLLEKNLVTVIGRATTPGRPLLYGTTADFLKHFGLNEISDLPKPREIDELIGETELEVEKRLLAEQQQLEFKEELDEKHETKRREKGEGTRRKEKFKPTEIAQPELLPLDQGASTESTVKGSDATSTAPEIAGASARAEKQRTESLTSQPTITIAVSQPESATIAGMELPPSMTPEDIPEGTRISAPIPGSPGVYEEKSAKGWTKWKTMIQTFFRKLFG